MRKALPSNLRKHVVITCIPLVGRRGVRRRVAPAGQFITSAGVDGILSQEAEIIGRFFPGAEFRMVELRDGNFNFIQLTPAEIPPADGAAAAALQHAEQSEHAS
jgi:hypothetical protein